MAGRGSSKGEYRGGRQKGTPNKRTTEKLLEQAVEVADSVKTGKKLAKHVLDDFMHLCAGMAAVYQPTAPDQPPNPTVDEAKFWQATMATLEFAKALAKYQSPTFRALNVQMQIDEPDKRPALPAPGGNVVSINDPEAAQRVYKRLIQQVG